MAEVDPTTSLQIESRDESFPWSLRCSVTRRHPLRMVWRSDPWRHFESFSKFIREVRSALSCVARDEYAWDTGVGKYTEECSTNRLRIQISKWHRFWPSAVLIRTSQHVRITPWTAVRKVQWRHIVHDFKCMFRLQDVSADSMNRIGNKQLSAFASAARKMRNCNSSIRNPAASWPAHSELRAICMIPSLRLRSRTRLSTYHFSDVTQNSVNLSDIVLVFTVLMFANQSISLYLLGTPLRSSAPSGD